MYKEGYFSHTSLDGRTMVDRVKETGITLGGYVLGENIASGQRDAVEVNYAWIKSFGHRENILDKEFRELGVGVYNDDMKGTPYYTEVFYSDL